MRTTNEINKQIQLVLKSLNRYGAMNGSEQSHNETMLIPWIIQKILFQHVSFQLKHWKTKHVLKNVLFEITLLQKLKCFELENI